MTKLRRILLVGGTGCVGRMILHHWRADPPDHIEIVEQHRDPTRTDGYFWSIESAPDSCLAAQGIDVIVSLAGVTPAMDADVSKNKSLGEAVLREAHSAGVGRVLLASSSAVYGLGDGTPFMETDPVRPANAYGAAKLEMEQACTSWRAQGLDICCLRIGNVAGADALLKTAARTPAGHALKIDCFADGKGPVRSYIGPATLAKVLTDLAMYPEPLPTVMNVAAPKVVYMEDLAAAAGQSFELRPAPEGAHQSITLDCTRLCGLSALDYNTANDPVHMVAQWKESLTT